MRSLSPGFIHQLTPYGPLLLYYVFFEFCFAFADLFELKIPTALWATAQNQIVLQIPGI